MNRADARTVALELLGTLATALVMVVLGGALGAVADGREISAGPIVIAVVLLVVIAVTAGLAELGARRAVLAEEASLRRRLLERVLAGGLVQMMTAGVERVAVLRRSFTPQVVGAVAGPLLVLIVVAVAVGPLPALVLLPTLVIVPLVIGLFAKAGRNASGRSRTARARLARRYLEALHGLETLAHLGAGPRVSAELAEVGETNRRATMSLLARNQLILLVSDAIFSLAVITTALALSTWQLSTGAVTTGQAIALVLLALMLTHPLDMIGSFFYIGMAGRAQQTAMSTLLEAEPHTQQRAPRDITDPDHPASRPGGIRVRDLVVTHPGHPDVLRGVDLDVDGGARVVVVGPSGAGKSTLLSVLRGDILPVSGTVLVGGVPLTAGTQEHVRARSAVVTQDTWLFTGTLAENLRVGGPDASEQELWEVLELVDLRRFAEALPEGLDTSVGERGAALSGGQLQRLSLARALLSRRPVLLLDEPTSQIDPDSERTVLEALERAAHDRTVVLVTHRTAPARAGGAVWRMQDGTLTPRSTADAR
jgi:ABC-type transport system involved in cytochrome bd biosynthesis fused ATPase/permease subunit